MYNNVFYPGTFKNPQLRDDFIAILLHELTHCAYTIKQNDIYKSEKQVLGRYEELLDGTTPLVDGNNTYMEPIINYVSTKIFGKKNGVYLAQTSNIAKLTNIIDEKQIVKNAFYSNEESFKECFKFLPDGAYEYFTDGMEWLNGSGEYGFRKETEIMNNFFNGIIPKLNQRKNQIKELKSLKSSLSQLQHLSQVQQLKQEPTEFLRKHGFIDKLLLTLVLFVVTCIVVIVTLVLIK